MPIRAERGEEVTVSELDNIKQVDRWTTSDGKEHYTLGSAQYHARNMDKAAIANAVLQSGGTVAAALIAADWVYDTPLDPMLDRITAATRLVISHWQCQDTPGYKVCYFNANRTVHVWGNAGSWTGSYGGTVKLDDLARYANDPATDFATTQPTPPESKIP
jgi:hypothetical protein